uniref:MBL fold metallo-hydrolase n=1 Tax=Hydrogenophaga sp. TaxID=1904254 RepID=UPI00356178EE
MADAITADTANAALRSAGVTVLERGWLSANNVLVRGDGPTALIDSGYCTHAEQTLALVAQALGGAALDLLLNTHLHSDHCGGNAALQQAYPGVATHIPPGLAQAV